MESNPFGIFFCPIGKASCVEATEVGTVDDGNFFTDGGVRAADECDCIADNLNCVAERGRLL